MIVLMKADKSLVISKKTRFYQKENVVSKLVFYIPETFEDNDLTKFTVTMNYSNQDNEAFIEILSSVDSDKDGYSKYILPIDTKFTKAAGDVDLTLSLTYLDEETSTQYVLHTGELTITIDSWADYFKFVTNDSLSPIDERILALQNETERLKSVADELDKEIPDDLKLTDDLLQLSKNGEAIGEGVEVLIPGDEDDEDENHDGVIDLDKITFVEL